MIASGHSAQLTHGKRSSKRIMLALPRRGSSGAGDAEMGAGEVAERLMVSSRISWEYEKRGNSVNTAASSYMERMTRLELATVCLEGRYSTN